MTGIFYFLDEEEEASLGQDLLSVPYNGTSSSTSFDLENAGTRIQQLAASDSDDYNDVASIKSESLICKYILNLLSLLKLTSMFWD